MPERVCSSYTHTNWAPAAPARSPGPGPGPGRGSILAVGNAGGWRGEDRNFCCHLVLPEDLEGSGLHQMLAEMTAGGEELRVVVDCTGETRSIRLEPADSLEQV